MLSALQPCLLIFITVCLSWRDVRQDVLSGAPAPHMQLRGLLLAGAMYAASYGVLVLHIHLGSGWAALRSCDAATLDAAFRYGGVMFRDRMEKLQCTLRITSRFSSHMSL